MNGKFADKILEKIDQAVELYHRLILLVSPSGTGKTAALLDVHERTGAPLLNINIELSRHLLDLTERQRILQMPQLLSDIVNEAKAEVILLDNIEMLFDVSLKQDPLRLLQGLSRNKTIVASWNGSIDREYITYAIPGHLEYRRYSLRDLIVINPEAVA